MSFHKQIDVDNRLQGLSTDKINFHPPTGISVLVVGAGVGGLMAALECRRKGHDVRVVERSPTPSTQGDFFSIGTNIIRHFYNFWPDLAAECERLNYQGMIAYYKITGEHISGPEPVSWANLTVTLADGTEKAIPFHRHNRPKFVAALLAQARRIGVDITFGTRVVDYFEDGENQKAGVILENGDKLEADIVIAADGVGTKSNKLVNGHDIRAYPSGFSIFRTAFPIDIALSDPAVRDRWPLLEGGQTYGEMWQGKDMSLTVQRYTDIMSWTLTHKDVGTGAESWSQSVDVSKALDCTSKNPGFPDIAKRLIKTTPKDALVDWEIMWRDPRENWISPLGRVVQVGDSAHTFLPSSGSGATQAMVDAISLATCLQIGGKSNIAWASKIHNKLQFQRVSCLQLNGFINHQRQNNTNFEVIGEDGDSFKSYIGKWALAHDPDKYAYDNYGKVLNYLLSGAPFRSTNIPPGYTHKPWTIQEMFDIIGEGRTIQFDGDWS
ncbi:FAD-dependent monooxygenase [Lachnellula occidentalis]|uniref:FAD-dependent monooxygenase n=1 Tax=Lachnellula occidentalis TaxID=215460 RepID=A0A8H8RXY6_9HELO|nr:FAD-dependent monooxygenase [Lachnellula occidentalis]